MNATAIILIIICIPVVLWIAWGGILLIRVIVSLPKEIYKEHKLRKVEKWLKEHPNAQCKINMENQKKSGH